MRSSSLLLFLSPLVAAPVEIIIRVVGGRRSKRVALTWCGRVVAGGFADNSNEDPGTTTIHHVPQNGLHPLTGRMALRVGQRERVYGHSFVVAIFPSDLLSPSQHSLWYAQRGNQGGVRGQAVSEYSWTLLALVPCVVAKDNNGMNGTRLLMSILC